MATAFHQAQDLLCEKKNYFFFVIHGIVKLCLILNVLLH